MAPFTLPPLSPYFPPETRPLRLGNRIGVGIYEAEFADTPQATTSSTSGTFAFNRPSTYAAYNGPTPRTVTRRYTLAPAEWWGWGALAGAVIAAAVAIGVG